MRVTVLESGDISIDRVSPREARNTQSQDQKPAWIGEIKWSDNVQNYSEEALRGLMTLLRRQKGCSRSCKIASVPFRLRPVYLSGEFVWHQDVWHQDVWHQDVWHQDLLTVDSRLPMQRLSQCSLIKPRPPLVHRASTAARLARRHST
jgi:hypothetical protein